ncbi:hypothetical protein TAF16_0430 [Anoxybacillus flavithermus]|uniref:Uncharacterized protein n=1 Tax=Anoxybacillus flavithermus TaxID=33934 RepID=A0A178TL80_9BACL|nr:hypothetical protein TAF16_0430 [Anoxybacillus flavithermus]
MFDQFKFGDTAARTQGLNVLLAYVKGAEVFSHDELLRYPKP